MMFWFLNLISFRTPPPPHKKRKQRENKKLVGLLVGLSPKRCKSANPYKLPRKSNNHNLQPRPFCNNPSFDCMPGCHALSLKPFATSKDEKGFQKGQRSVLASVSRATFPRKIMETKKFWWLLKDELVRFDHLPKKWKNKCLKLHWHHNLHIHIIYAYSNKDLFYVILCSNFFCIRIQYHKLEGSKYGFPGVSTRGIQSDRSFDPLGSAGRA